MKTKLKAVVAVLLAVILCVPATVVPAFAQEIDGETEAVGEQSLVEYVDEDGVTQQASAVSVTSPVTEWAAGWYAVTADTSTFRRITCTGDVNLILCDGATLTADSGITVNEGSSLTVYGQSAGTGALTVEGYNSTDSVTEAFIGGKNGKNSGTITFNGGVINVTSRSSYFYAAAIGGGAEGKGYVTINGGTVNAIIAPYRGATSEYPPYSSETKATVSGAAIGGGRGAGGNVTINGGTVNAVIDPYWQSYTSFSDRYCDIYGAAIGGGASGNGFVDVTGGTVNAEISNPDAHGAAIGGGSNCDGSTITLNGGTVTATNNGAGAAVGGGRDGDANVVIDGGTVTATTNGYGAGVGAAFVGNADVVINGGNVNASSIGCGVIGGGTVELSWTNAADSLYSGGYIGTVTLKKEFKDNAGTVYPAGEIDASAIAGKTLAPPDAMEYLDLDGNVRFLSQAYGTVSTASTALTSGWYAVTENTAIDSRVTVTGNVNLILCDGAELTVPKGINAAEGNSLTIWQQRNKTGKLTVTAPDNKYAALGGGNTQSAGNVTVNGGVLNLTSTYDAAALGGGYGSAGGKITITGGTVTATPGGYGAQALGHGASVTDSGTLTLGTEDVRIKVGTVSGSTVSYVDAANRVSTAQSQTSVHTEVCDHHYVEGVCTWCGADAPEHEIKFVDEDGTVLQSSMVRESVTPVYSGSTPTKAADAQYTYTFKEWSPAVTAVTGDATYTATYDRTVNQYTVTFLDYDGTELQSGKLDYRATPAYSGEGPARPREGDTFYAFTGWSPAIADVTADATYTAQYEVRKLFAGHSLSLHGDIGLNFYVDLTDEEINSGATVSFSWTVDDVEKTDSVFLTSGNKTDNGYIATCNVAVAEMTYDVTAVLTVGGERYGTDTYSVKKYADTTLSADYKAKFIQQYDDDDGEYEYSKLETLVKTMLSYGAKAQMEFNRNTDNLADEDIDYTMSKVTADMITSTASDMASGLEDYGLEYAGTTILYQSKTSLRHYYKITDQTKFDSVKDDVKFNGADVEYITKADGKIYFEMKNIAAADLDAAYTLKIGTNEYQYSVLDYVRECLNAKNAPYTTRQLVSATYWYNQAANAYFG